jgi:predicted permease
MRLRKWAAAFANLEATFLISLAVYLFARTVSSDVEELDAVIAEIIFLIALGVAYYMIDGDRITWGITLGAIAITTAGLSIAAIPRQIGGNGSASL